MFYNTYRTTKSSMLSAEKTRFTGAGKNIINQRERLLNLQKRQKLKDLLITKFMQKYGVKNPEKILEEEITKFLQGEKLTDADLKRLDIKVKNLLQKKASKEALKNTLLQSHQEIPKKVVLPKIETKDDNKEPILKSISPTILSTEPVLSTVNANPNNQRYLPMKTFSTGSLTRTYKKPEEELAELEAEFAEDEEKKKKKYERLNFSQEGGDEWYAIAKYNRKLYEDQINEEKRKDAELKRRNKEDLDFQVKQKLKKEYEEELKEKEYDKIIIEHLKKEDEIEKQKQEQIKKQIMKEKECRDEQMRLNNIKKRIEYLKEKKFEKILVKSIQDGIEREKQEILERKRRENEALISAIRENEIKIRNKKEKEKLEKEEEKEEKKEEKEKEEPNIQSDIYAELFLDKIFQSSIAQNIEPQPLNKNRILQIESICKVGYAGPGVKKKNQDNFFIYKKFLNDSDITFLGVCDGHGMFGHDISGYLVNMLPQNLNNNLTKENIKTINNDNEYDKISDIISNTYVQTNMNLVNNSSIDCTYSGSTCTSLIISSEKIISINVGDSRCVLGKYINNKWLAQNLTRDHKPTEEDEKKRIIDKGGRIEAYKDDSGEYVGPERVWLKGEDLPGLAMSRSFGDDVAHMIGVTSKPEIKEFKLSEEDKFILLGSDGIFEFISSDDSVNMVKDFYLKNDINGALNHLYKTSSQKWIMEEEVIDDITLIIIFLK